MSDACEFTIRRSSLACLRCAREYPEPALELLGAGCPACAADGVPANVLPVRDVAGLRREPPALPRRVGEPGLFVHRDLLPLDQIGRAHV